MNADEYLKKVKRLTNKNAGRLWNLWKSEAEASSSARGEQHHCQSLLALSPSVQRVICTNSERMRQTIMKNINTYNKVRDALLEMAEFKSLLGHKDPFYYNFSVDSVKEITLMTEKYHCVSTFFLNRRFYDTEEVFNAYKKSLLLLEVEGNDDDGDRCTNRLIIPKEVVDLAIKGDESWKEKLKAFDSMILEKYEKIEEEKREEVRKQYAENEEKREKTLYRKLKKKFEKK
jgi:hypothetical protein